MSVLVWLMGFEFQKDGTAPLQGNRGAALSSRFKRRRFPVERTPVLDKVT